MELKPVYHAGYSGHKPEELKRIAYLLGAVVVDIRYKPYSRVPGWNYTALVNLFGVQNYQWVQALGNRNYSGQYGEGVQIANIRQGLGILKELAHYHPLILLCRCPLFLTCHRSEVALEFENRFGQKVYPLDWNIGLYGEETARTG